MKFKMKTPYNYVSVLSFDIRLCNSVQCRIYLN